MKYMGAHAQTRRVRGEVTLQKCVTCGAQAREWAYDHADPSELVDENHGTFSLDPMHYQPMCLRCHRLFDKSAITHCPHGHPYEGENLIYDAGKRKCRICVYHRNNERRKRTEITPEQQAHKMKLQRIRRRRAAAEKRSAA